MLKFYTTYVKQGIVWGVLNDESKVGDSLNMGFHFMEAIQVHSMTTLQI